jgi:hypothetical protein
MKKGNLAKISLCSLLCMQILLTGCCINISGCCREEYEKTEHLTAPLSSGQTLNAQTEVGTITVSGADVTDCNVIATITAKAPTKEKAKELAEEVKIKLEPSGNILNVNIEKPHTKNKCSICVSFEIIVPAQTALQVSTNVGETRISNITGSIQAATNVGTITCKDIAGDADITTNVGEVKVAYSETAPAACHAAISTSVGNINFTAPPALSAVMNVSVNIGSIHTDLPLLVTGEIHKSLNGIVGEGRGKVILSTNIGSIKIR